MLSLTSPPRQAGSAAWRGGARRRGRARGARLATAASSGSTRVRFAVHKRVEYGQCLRVVGDLQELGGWDVQRAPALAWGEGDVWTGEVALPPGSSPSFKFVVCTKKEAVEWEGGENRQTGGAGVVEAHFGDNAGGGGSAKSVGHSRRDSGPSRSEDDDEEDGGPGASPSRVDPADSLVLALAGGDGKWRGGEVTFMRSNAHTGDRRGTWRPEGLPGAARALVEGDMRAGSWLQKLEVIAELALDELATSAVYLQWVSTGVVPCVEGGGHQRPNKAATVGRGIFIAMERALGDSYGNPGVDELSRLSCRAILPWLPSFSGSFTQAVPLTRIRDIAHRNDIPSDLKQEIKHTIQNKLHRNAGPEDLVATEAMLQRISAVPGQYSAPFVAEFRTFHAELKDFFNARTAFERLDDLQGGLDDTGKGAVNTLRAAKAALDSGTTQQALDDWLRAHGKELGATRGERERELVLATLHAATTVRACLVSMLSSGLRNDAPDSALVTRQGVRNAELALEEYGFVLASRVSTSLEADSASGVSTHWGPPLTACILLLRHLGLSGFRQAECAATEAGLAAARDNPLTGRPDPAATDATLAARAAVQRAQRLAESHSQALMSCFSGRAVTLGTGLGISAASAGVHGEACVRAAVSFPLSNLASWLLRACDAATGGDGTETLVAGTAVGTVISLPRLTPDALASAGVKKQQRVVVLLASADGDEDVSALGVDIAGLVLTQQLPHLSHLAVRARQQHTVLVTCAPGAALAQAAKAAVGKQALLKALPEGGATLSDPPSASAAPAAAAPTAKAASRKAGAVQKASSCALVPLSEATPETCGAKAATCGQLLRVAQKVSVSSPPAAFGAPDGCVLPFGSMEAALREAGTLDRYVQLCGELDAACAAGAPLDAFCESAHILLAAARPPGGVLDKVQQRVSSREAFVCVRSSANVEDLEGMSGAGLYTSLAGIPVADVNALGGAVAAVWASLHTPRAVRARAAAGVRQGDAVMAVLLQEQVPSQLAFVLHTQAPGNKALVLAELCVGHGETLASGARGSGWRLEVGPPGVGAAPGAASGVTTRSFANFSTAALPPKPGVPGMVEVRVDYSRQALTVDPVARETLGARLGAVGRALQAELGGVAQDVEGAVVGDAIVVVQSRPQPL